MMAITKDTVKIFDTFKASADLTDKWRIVIGDTAKERGIKAPTADTNKALGVIENETAKSGKFIPLCLFGITKIKTGAAVTRYDLVQINGVGGKIKTLAATGYPCGMALESATSGDTIPVFFWGNMCPDAKS